MKTDRIKSVGWRLSIQQNNNEFINPVSTTVECLSVQSQNMPSSCQQMTWATSHFVVLAAFWSKTSRFKSRYYLTSRWSFDPARWLQWTGWGRWRPPQATGAGPHTRHTRRRRAGRRPQCQTKNTWGFWGSAVESTENNHTVNSTSVLIAA